MRGDVRRLELVVGAILAGLGWWQLAFTATVRMGWSFTTLAWLSPVAVVLGVLTARWLARTDIPATPEAGRDVDPRVFLVLVPAVLAALAYPFDLVGWRTTWVLGSLGLAGVAWFARGQPEEPEPGGTLAVLFSAWVGALLSLSLNRPEGDDGFYVAQVRGNLAHADLPLLSFDVLHGDLSLPVQQPAHRAQGFETLVSAASWWTGVDAADMYYIAFPAFFGALVGPAFALLARPLLGAAWSRATGLLAVGTIAVWAGHYYAVGNLGFARIFQGKGVIVSVSVPLLAWAALRFSRSPTAAGWLLLTLAGSATVLATSTGLLVGPMALGLALLGGVQLHRRGLLALGAGLAASAPMLAMLLMVRADVAARGGREGMGFTGVRSGILEVFGDSPRVGLGLAAILVLPALLRLGGFRAAVAARYALAIWVLLLNEWLGEFLVAKAGALFSWRILWALPAPVFVAGVAAVLGAIALGERHSKAWRGFALWSAVMWMCLFTTTGDTSWSEENRNEWGFAEHKVTKPGAAVARAIAFHTDPDDLVLMPEALSIFATRVEDPPKFLAVRRIYLQHLAEYLDKEDITRRSMMMLFVGSKAKGQPLFRFMDNLDRYCVTVVMTSRTTNRARPGLPRSMRERGFELRETRKDLPDGIKLWKRSADACPAERPE